MIPPCQANVDLVNNLVEFNVRGLVLAGGNAIGTTGAVSAVEGTLVCNPSGTGGSPACSTRRPWP